MTKISFQDKLKQLGKQAKAQRQLKEQETIRIQQQSLTEDVDFAKAMGSQVIPLKPRNQFQHPREKSFIKPRPKQTDYADDTTYFYIGDSQYDTIPAYFSKNGRGKQDIQRLQNKHWPIVAYVDLHGYRQDEAQDVLNEFIDYVQQHGVVGEIVHGSGLGSKNYQPVLKNIVRRWLMEHPQVLAYAQPNERNDGAVYVLVKRKQHKPEE